MFTNVLDKRFHVAPNDRGEHVVLSERLNVQDVGGDVQDDDPPNEHDDQCGEHVHDGGVGNVLLHS